MVLFGVFLGSAKAASHKKVTNDQVDF